jgi:hypothetical protein
MRTGWILATALALSFSPALSQGRERAHRGNGRSGHTEQRSQVSRHDSHRERSSREFRRAPRYRWARRSIHIHPSFLPSHRHGYFWSSGYYYPRYYFEYDAYPERASLRIQANPPEAEVYVDGYYAGIVDDFDGVFQRLHVTPGTHEITLRLDGFRTWSAEIYAAPHSTVKVHQDLIPGPGAEADVYED